MAGLAGLAAGAAPGAASADPTIVPIPTTTTIFAPAWASKVGSGSPVQITASVNLLGVLPGLLITPTGTVTFAANYTDGSGNNQVLNIGTQPLAVCLLSPCIASITSSSIPRTAFSLVANYNGSLLALPSSTTLTATSVTCPAHQTCDAGTVGLISPNGDTFLDAVGGPAAESQTVSESLAAGPPMQCSQAPHGALGDFSTTAADATLQADYITTGQLAQNVDNAYMNNKIGEFSGAFLGCYAQNSEFTGVVNGMLQPAPRVVEPFGVVFEAQLANCSLVSSGNPCFFNSFNNETGTDDVTTFATGIVGDPHVMYP